MFLKFTSFSELKVSLWPDKKDFSYLISVGVPYASGKITAKSAQ